MGKADLARILGLDGQVTKKLKFYETLSQVLVDQRFDLCWLSPPAYRY